MRSASLFLTLLLLLVVVVTNGYSFDSLRTRQRGWYGKGLRKIQHPRLFVVPPAPAPGTDRGDNSNDAGGTTTTTTTKATDDNDMSSKQLSRIEAVRKMLRTEALADESQQSTVDRRDILINFIAAGLVAVCGVAATQLYRTSVYTPDGFQRLPTTQFIAALGDPQASSGMIPTDQPWGLWRVDPGPRGVWLKDYNAKLAQQDNVAPAGWKFTNDDWWLEEHGLIMESPTFPLPPGRYLVTGGRSVTTGLTVDPTGQHWRLDHGTLYDVTHLPCRAARYRGGSPRASNPNDFPVTPGAIMPTVPGVTSQQDYAVLFLVGRAKSSVN